MNIKLDITTIDELEEIMDAKMDEIKNETKGRTPTKHFGVWLDMLDNKSMTVVYKNEQIAILRGTKMSKSLPEFIVAFDQLTKEGYRLMSSGPPFDTTVNILAGSGGPEGDIFFYFQKF